MTSKKKQVLEVQERKACGSANARRERKAGKIPAVVYGHGAVPQHILLDGKAWGIVSKQDVQIVELKKSSGDNLNVLIKSVQYDFLTGAPKHVDFLEVKMDEIITASVPIHGHGTPAGLSQGGVLEQQIHEIEIHCTPLALPESIEIDITELQVGDSLHISEIPLPEGVTLASEADQTVFQVAMAKVEEEAAGTDEDAAEGGAEGAATQEEEKKEESE